MSGVKADMHVPLVRIRMMGGIIRPDQGQMNVGLLTLSISFSNSIFLKYYLQCPHRITEDVSTDANEREAARGEG